MRDMLFLFKDATTLTGWRYMTRRTAIRGIIDREFQQWALHLPEGVGGFSSSEGCVLIDKLVDVIMNLDTPQERID